MSSFIEISSGTEMIKAGESAGFEFLDTECRTSSAWNIGRMLRDTSVDKCVELIQLEQGPIRQSAKARFTIPGGCRTPSVVEVTYSLDAGGRALRVATKADWQEQGGETIPVLMWKTPLSQPAEQFRYLIPAGSKLRPALNNDVPGIGGGAAILSGGHALVLVSDSKYGYRGEKDALSLTLINSAVNPDPYPERGIHHITLWLSIAAADAQDLQRLTDELNHPLLYQPGNVHAGKLPTCFGLVELISSHAVISSIQPVESGLMIRGYETAGEDGDVRIRMGLKIRKACLTDLSERRPIGEVRIENDEIVFPVRTNGIWCVVATA